MPHSNQPPASAPQRSSYNGPKHPEGYLDYHWITMTAVNLKRQAELQARAARHPSRPNGGPMAWNRARAQVRGGVGIGD